MSFQNPAALAWLLPLASVIVLLYLLKMKRRDMRVPASFLWPERVDEVRANALFQKLRLSWLLFLQLLALSLVVFAFAKPQTQQRGLAGDVTVIVLDSSASMSATDVRPSRFEEARRLARETIKSARPSDRIALIEAGPTPRVVFPLGRDPAHQVMALDRLQPTDAETDVGESLRLAGALVGTIDGARIVLLSDGDFEPVTNFSPGKAAVTYRRIGDQDDNVSIAALGFTDTPTGRQLFAEVKNDSFKKMEATLSIYGDGRPIDSIRTGAIAPFGQFGRTVSVPTTTKVFEAKVDAPDILKSDNYAVCLSDPGASLHVLLISKGNPFLERALALDPRVTLDRATELPLEERVSSASKYDLIVFDGISEESVKSRAVLTFGSFGDSSPVTGFGAVSGTVKGGEFVSAESTPLMKSVDLRHVFIDRQVQVSPRPDGEVLAQSSAGPLVVRARSPGKTRIYVAFEPLQSDFPLQVGFPIFVSNVLDEIGGAKGSETIAIRAGVPFSIPSLSGGTLVAPDGSKTDLKPTGGTLVVREVKNVGTYSLRVDGKTRTIYSYLRSDRESSVGPTKQIALGGGQVKESLAPARFADFWRPIALVCLLVLAGEWWLFARKS